MSARMIKFLFFTLASTSLAEHHLHNHNKFHQAHAGLAEVAARQVSPPAFPPSIAGVSEDLAGLAAIADVTPPVAAAAATFEAARKKKKIKTKKTTTAKTTSTSSTKVAPPSTSSTKTTPASTKQPSAIPTSPTGPMRTPTPTFSTIHGSATYSPASQYLVVPAQTITAPAISTNLLAALGPNPDLQNNYPIFTGTGLLQVNSSNSANLANMNTIPWMSRDGGHGGVINGHKIFYFADTCGFTHPTPSQEGTWTGCWSNSIAMDVGNGPYNGQALTLQDPIGAFASPSGAQRTFIPFTDGEQAFTWQNDYAKRYAIWPWGSLVPYNNDSSLLYAPIVFQDNSQNPAFQNGGVTLAKLSVTDDGQPIVNRDVPLLFPSAEAQFGVVGGIRSWGPSGVGGDDGKVYVFATGTNGLLLGRVDVQSVDDVGAYEYWTSTTNPSSWSSSPTTATNFLPWAFSSGDLIYSPHHGTFLLIFQNPYCDSQFWYSYLLTPTFISPSYTGNPATYVDIVENIYKLSWSNPQVLLETPVLATGKYTYDGGVLQGYFEGDDVVNGGTRMLLHWTAPTNADAGSVTDGYQYWSAEIRWA